MILVPMKLEILAAKAGGWRWRLEAVETSAITWLSPFEGYSNPADARQDAIRRIESFNAQFKRRMKMIVQPTLNSQPSITP